MKRLFATVGLPRSGKTTWAQKQSYPIVCPDAIRIALHGQRYFYAAEPFVWAQAELMVRSLFGAGHDVVILDAPNLVNERRKQWLSKEYRTTFVINPTPAEICIERARKADDDYIIPVIEKMNLCIEMPDMNSKDYDVSMMPTEIK